MNKKQQIKFIAIVGMLPLAGDFIEDLLDVNLKRELKQQANILIANIRRFDKMLMDESDLESIEQQNEIQRALRQWVNDNIKPDEV
jgi:uncharacterized protein YprB with RNaseH-like and TPR domain